MKALDPCPRCGALVVPEVDHYRHPGDTRCDVARAALDALDHEGGASIMFGDGEMRVRGLTPSEVELVESALAFLLCGSCHREALDVAHELALRLDHPSLRRSRCHGCDEWLPTRNGPGRPRKYCARECEDVATAEHYARKSGAVRKERLERRRRIVAEYRLELAEAAMAAEAALRTTTEDNLQEVPQ